MLIFIAGELVNNSRFVIDHSRLIMVGKAHRFDKISNIFAKGRKICRLSRTKGLSEDLKSVVVDWYSEKRSIVSLEKLFGVLGDLCNVAFFFGDQYTSLFLVNYS